MDLQIIKKIKTCFLIWSLLINYSVFAQNQQPVANPNQAVVVQQGPDSFNAAVQNITSAASGAIQQGMMGKWEIEKQAMMYMQGLQNNPVNLQQVGSKLFPNCILPQTRVNRFSENGLCKGEVNDPTMHQQAIQMEKYARDIWNNYENNLKISHSSVASSPAGLTCIQRSTEQVLNELLAKKNEFNTIRNRLEITLKDYLKALEARKLKMANIQRELEGDNFGNGAQPFWNHTKLYSAFPDCAEALSANNVNTGGAKGLLGLKREFESTLTPALQVIDGANNNSLISSAKIQAKEIIRKMKESDVETVAKSLQNTSFSDGQAEFKFGSFKDVVKEKAEAFQNKVKRINANLKKSNLNIELPVQDADFQKNLDVKSFETTLKNGYYTKCISTQSGKDNKVNIWDQITNKSVSGAIRKSKTATTNIDVFKKEFQKIFDRADLTWPQKVAMVKNLEGNQEFVLAINESYDNQSAKKDWRPSELLSSIYKNCENTLMKAPYMGDRTQNDVINELKADLTNIKNDDKNFYDDLENSLIDRVANCTNVTYDSTPGMCTKEKLNTNHPSFCLAQSRQCAEKIQSCYKQIDNRQKEVSGKLEQETQAFNAAYNDLEAKINQEISLMAEALKFQQSFITARFPGAIESSSSITNDLFIDFGSPEETASHLQLIKAGETKNVSSEVKSKIDKLGTTLDSTLANLKSYLEQEKNQIKDNLQKEQEYWKQVKDDCGKADSNYRNKLAKAQEKAAEDQKKLMGDQFKKRDAFCLRYDAYKAIPSCTNIAALNDAIIATDREFIRGLGSTNLVSKIQQTCGGKIDNLDLSQMGSSKITGDGETDKDKPAEGIINLHEKLGKSKCSEEHLREKSMGTFSGQIKRLAYATGKSAGEISKAIEEGKLGDMIPEAVKNKIKPSNLNINGFISDYKSKYCQLKEKDKEEFNKSFSIIYNTIDFVANNVKRKPGNMGENNPSDGQSLHIPGCESIQGNTPRQAQPTTFTGQVDSMINGAGGARGQ